MTQFSDIPKFLITEYITTLVSLDESVPTSTIINAHLKGDSFITRGGNIIELYIDNDDGYKKIILSFKRINDEIVYFEKHDQLTYEDSSIIYGGGVEDSYSFEIYDASTMEAVVVESSQNVYFRKDSVFHDWLKDGSDTIFQNRWYVDFLTDNFVNTNELFVYFGKIYETNETDTYIIKYENLPEFIKKSLPEHQRTDRIKEFINLSFGNIFSEIYHKTKNLPRLIDAMSVNDNMLNYIVEFTNWSFLVKDEYTLAEREFVRDIVSLLKRKGTISSIYLLYKVFSNNSNNRLNVYERWHRYNFIINGGFDSDILSWTTLVGSSSSVSGGVSGNCCEITQDSYFNTTFYQDTTTVIGSVYTVKFWLKKGSSTSLAITCDVSDISEYISSAPVNWTEYSFDFTAISTTSRLEFTVTTITGGPDLNVLIDSVSINRKGTINESEYLDYLYLHNYISSLDDSYLDTGAGRKYYDQFFPDFEWGSDNTSVTIHSGSSDWNVSHNLNSYNIIYQAVDTNFKRIVPKTSYLSSKNVLTLTFDENVNGYCFIKAATYRKDISDTSTIDHTFEWLPTSMNYDTTNYGTTSELIKLTDGFIETDQTEGYMVIGEATEKVVSGSSSDVWNLTHTIEKRGILVDIYNGDNERIVPDEMQIIDKDSVQITLSESLSGYALLTEIGTSPTALDQILSFDDLILSPSYIVELDLTTEPMDDDVILSETTSETLISYWEKTRPINNVSKYQILISPKTDTSGGFYDLYESVTGDVYAKSQLIAAASYFDIGDLSSYFVSNFVSSNTQWIVNHNLNKLNLIVQCYNDSNELVRPSSITYTDVNTITIDFVNSMNGKVLIVESDYNTTTSSDSIVHSRGYDVIETTLSDSDVYEPDKVTLTNDNTLTVTDIISDSNVNIKGDVDVETFSFTDSSIWNIEHDTGYTWFISEFYNEDDEQIYPETLKIIDNNTAQAIFSKTVTGTGYVVLSFIPDSDTMYTKLTGSFITISDTQDDATTTDYKATTTIEEDINFVYLTAEIPKEDKYTIREIGVLDNADEVLFTTICSDIVKDNDIKMTIFYKISKENLNV